MRMRGCSLANIRSSSKVPFGTPSGVVAAIRGYLGTSSHIVSLRVGSLPSCGKDNSNSSGSSIRRFIGRGSIGAKGVRNFGGSGNM